MSLLTRVVIILSAGLFDSCAARRRLDDQFPGSQTIGWSVPLLLDLPPRFVISITSVCVLFQGYLYVSVKFNKFRKYLQKFSLSVMNPFFFTFRNLPLHVLGEVYNPSSMSLPLSQCYDPLQVLLGSDSWTSQEAFARPSSKNIIDSAILPLFD